MDNCNLCPRKCNINRSDGKKGFCGVSDNIKIARAALHMWEEPCISGEEGSGAVFFSGCNLGCVYCQNYEISRGFTGKEVSADVLSDIFLKLASEGANNINLVTPSHYALHIREAIDKARRNGLSIPIVYNTGSYENVETLKLLEGYIDVYLPDCKYYSDDRAIKYSKAPNYFETAINAIDEMMRQVGEPLFNERGIMTKGVIIRHMTLPSGTMDSKEIIKRLYDRYGDKVYLSLMSQYTPMKQIDGNKYPELVRKITKREYEKIIDYAISLGIENAFIQEGDVAEESFIPEFDLTGVI